MRSPLASTFPILIAASLLSGTAHAQAPQLQVIVGSVDIGHGDPPRWRAARVGDRLAPGDVVRTGSGARAELITPAGTLRLYERSFLRISDAAHGVDLEEGASLFDIKTRIGGRPYEVRTPHAVVMVKGTRFSVSVDAEQASVGVIHGLVGVRGLAGKAREILVHPGFRLVGGPTGSFTLDLLSPGHDPWTTWSSGERLARSAIGRQAAAAPRDALAAARAATHRTVERELHIRPPERKVPSAVHGAGLKRADPVQPRAARKGSRDDRLKRHQAPGLRRVIGQNQIKAALGDMTSFSVVPLGNSGKGSGKVRITGPAGLNTTLTKNDLKSVLNGNSSALGADLLSLVQQNGIAPAAFADQLLNLH